MNRSKWRELKAGWDEPRRARVRAKVDAIRAELMLRDLRRRCGLTQVEMARRLGMSQAALSQMERQGDMQLSTLRRLIEAMGGHLQLVATLPDQGELRLRLGEPEDG